MGYPGIAREEMPAGNMQDVTRHILGDLAAGVYGVANSGYGSLLAEPEQEPSPGRRKEKISQSIHQRSAE